jgi:hypothetical protein
LIKKTIYIFLFSFLRCTFQSSAQGLLPKLGEQRAGTAAVTFLKIGVGARAVSMGGAFVALANDGSSMFWNPAGLVQIGKNEFTVSHLDWLVDVDFEYLGYVHQLNNNIALGAFMGYLHLADMPVTTEFHPYGNGEYFSYNDMVTGLTISIKMTDRFSFGVTTKYVREDLAELSMHGVMLDFGTYYWTGFKTLRIAASMKNFGTDLRPNGTYMRREANGTTEAEFQAFSPPTVFTMGAAMDVYTVGQHIFTGAMQMNHPMDDQENFVMGAEYKYRRMFFLRTGYLANMDENKWTFGAGTNFSFYGKKVKLDYSYADYNHLSMTQQITFGFEF